MQPLVLTADAALLEEVARLAAGAGVATDRREDLAEALGLWSTAPLVLLGVDQLVAVAGIGPPKRDRVVVVCLSLIHI